MTKHPARAGFRQRAAKLLEQNPELWPQLKADLEGVQSGEAIPISVAAQKRPPDWKHNPDHPPRAPVRVLYHFTTHVHLPSILRDGINRGDVAVDPDNRSERGYNSPSPTDDSDYGNQHWSHPPGTEIEPGVSTIYDKTEVRLTVHIPEDDDALHPWRDLLEAEGADDWWIDALDEVAQNTGDRHYVYKGLIPPSWIVSVDWRDSEPDHSDSRFGFGAAPLELKPRE